MFPKLCVWLAVFICLFIPSNCDNETSTQELVPSVASYVPEKNDECTNECSPTNPYYWCGNLRLDSRGQVSRCRQYTYQGSVCVWMSVGGRVRAMTGA